MRAWIALALGLLWLSGCGQLPPGLPPGLTPLSQAELKYRLVDRFGPPFYCDPDQYPVARADERSLALKALPEIQRDQATYDAIIRHNKLNPSTLSEQDKVTIYRDWKMLNTITLTPDGSVYRFQGRFADRGSTKNSLDLVQVSGTIDGSGAITVVSSVASGGPACPICLGDSTLIATPDGPVAVSGLRVGMLVWTRDASGGRVAAAVLRTGSVPAPRGHLMAHLSLADGRQVLASPGHPIADGRRLGELQAGDPLDGSVVIAAELVPYRAERTYDLLPAGPTGTYWADGVLLGSTLKY